MKRFLARLRLAMRIWWGGRPHHCPDPWRRSWRLAGMYLSMLLLVGCTRPAPAAHPPCAATVLPVYDREPTEAQWLAAQRAPAELQGDIASAQEVQQALDIEPQDAGEIQCGDVILQWVWSSRRQAGPEIVYPNGACDFCVLSCVSTTEAMWGSEAIEGDGGAFINAVITCVAAHCPKAHPEDRP